ncbi:excinuclease ABC subunit UvrC [Patescibacteria group bacterium]|nr:MAG: excinuclease ABC subunit UvrC [Patescibacteria group bacterium]
MARQNRAKITKLAKQTEGLPNKPGVYLFKDQKDKPIYVGKAKNLKKRVNSYFKADRNSKARRILAKTSSLESIVVSSEVEALILESNLVKRYQPKYNVDLKDDKNFLYLRISVQEDFPRVNFVRRVEKDKAKYFGPFTNAKEIRSTLKFVRRIFPFRTCSLKIKEGKKQKPCLDLHLGKCIGPCLDNVEKNDYRKIINDLILFLEGKQNGIIDRLKDQMEKAVKSKDFEKAAKLRDQLRGFKQLTIRQKVISTNFVDQDLIGLRIGNKVAVVNLFMIRSGKLTGCEYFTLKNVNRSSRGEVLSSFIQNYYQKVADFPKEVILDLAPDQLEILSAWLNKISDHRIKIIISKKGNKKKLLKLANENAELYLNQIVRLGDSRLVIEKALKELLKVIQHPKLLAPKKFDLNKAKRFRIEGYDISNLQGKDAYGSMVVLEFFKKEVENKDKGTREKKWLLRLAKDQYRIFRVRTVTKPNDYRMFGEVLSRRLGNRKKHSDDESFRTLPDLILIDGGKGQLNAALKVLKSLDLTIPAISLAKKDEVIFTPLNKDGIKLEERSQVLKIIQKIRDESHRFSLKFHRNLRSKSIRRGAR